MNTPILDFVRAYEESGTTRFHMPGHKGKAFLGCESWDITEIKGADSLYEADGIIAQSEANAAHLFGTAKTLYSTEGSSQVIRAMVTMAVQHKQDTSRPWFLAARNAHKAFLYALALADADVTWLWPENTTSICSCVVTAKQVEDALKEAKSLPVAVYLTSPDYLGNQQPIREIAEVCHRYGTLLLVDNAHGAYLRFLSQSQHPMDLGADLCCDSAHKTLPVLTGGAYLHISHDAPTDFAETAKQALLLHGSTSPSYLILMSLDLCNRYLDSEFPQKTEQVAAWTTDVRMVLRKHGWNIVETEPLKLTIHCPKSLPGNKLAERLRLHGIECEYADPDFVVLMISAETTKEDLNLLVFALGINGDSNCGAAINAIHPIQACSVRKAIFATYEMVSLSAARGKIAAAPTVGCPPAIPIVVSGEKIDQDVQSLLRYYGIDRVAVIKEKS